MSPSRSGRSRPLPPLRVEREIVVWPCPGGCRGEWAVYRGDEPRHWIRRADGVLLCPSCYRRWRRAEERKEVK
jgi:hypothetical protein